MINTVNLIRRIHQSFSRYARELYRKVPVILALTLCGVVSNIYAQQASGNQPQATPSPSAMVASSKAETPAIAASLTPSSLTEDKKGNKGEEKKNEIQPLSEREKALLDACLRNSRKRSMVYGLKVAKTGAPTAKSLLRSFSDYSLVIIKYDDGSQEIR